MNPGKELVPVLVADDDRAARKVLGEAGLNFEERRVVTVVLRDQPGALADLAEALAATGTNIEALYLLHTNDDGMHFAMAVDDDETAMQHLAAAE